MKLLPLLAFGACVLAAQLHAETELIANDKFADNGAAWSLKTAPDAVANMAVVDESGEKALRIEVQEPPRDRETPPDVRVQRLFGELVQDKSYEVSFKAKAESPAKIVSYVYPETEGARVLWRVENSVDTEWKDFQFSFTGRDTADNCVLGFSNLGKMGNKYFFKDVVLTVR